MNIVVADDHSLIREGLERTLKSVKPNTVIHHAQDRDSVLSLLEQSNKIDLILLDLVMPGANGFALLETICKTYKKIPVIVISSSEEPEDMRKAIDCGAAGFIPKSATTEIMINAINLVCSGGVYLPANILQYQDNKTPNQNYPDTVSLIDKTIDASLKLTKRQKEVLELMAKGLANKEIARALSLSEHTVKIHVTAILRLFNAENRTEAVVMAHATGIIKRL